MIIVINRWSVAAGCANRGLRRADSTTADRRCYDKLLNYVLHSEQLVLNPLNVIALYTALELGVMIKHFRLTQTEGYLLTF